MSNNSFIAASMLKIRQYIIIICAPLLSMMPMNVIAQTQVDRAEVRRQIEFHRKWMAEHTPKPQSLNDSALILETVRAIHTVCHEPQVGAMIRHAGKKFGIKELEEYATLRDRQDIDRDNALARVCLRLLAEQARKRLGEASYPEAYAYYFMCQGIPDFREYRRKAPLFYDAARAAFEADTTDVHSYELWLMAQIKQLEEESILECPTTYRDKRLLADCIRRFYMDHPLPSIIHVHLPCYIAQIFGSSDLYPMYYWGVDRELLKAGISADQESGWLPAWDQVDDHDNICYRAAFEYYRKLLHPYHPDVLNLEATYLYQKRSFNKNVLPRLRDIQAFMREYDTRRHWMNPEIEGFIRDCEIYHQQNEKDTTFLYLREITRAYISSDKSDYLFFLSEELCRQTAYGSSNVIEIADEIDSLGASFSCDDKMEALHCQLYKTWFQRLGLSGREYALYDLAQEYLDCYQEYPQWSTVSFGKELARILMEHFHDTRTALLLLRKTTALARQIVGEQHPIFLAEYTEYIKNIANSGATPLTLEGEENSEALFEDILHCTKTTIFEPASNIFVGMCKFQTGQYSNARSMFLQALELAEMEADKQQVNDSITAGGILTDRGLLYTYILQTLWADESSQDSIDFYGQWLCDYCETAPYVIGENWMTFKNAAQYYAQKGETQKANNLLHKCLTEYDRWSGVKVDFAYLDIIQNLIIYAAKFLNDMDECQALAERLERDIQGFENVGNYVNHIALLKMLYELVEAKNPYDMALFGKYLPLLSTAINAYWKASNHDKTIWYDHYLFLYSKMLNIMSRMETFRAIDAAVGNDMEAFDANEAQMKESVISNLVPELQEYREELEEEYPNARQMPPTYYQIITCQALAAEYCQEDTVLAEKYLRELAEKVGGDALTMLGQFYIKYGRIAEALPIFQRIDSLFHDPQGFDMQNPTANLRGKINTVGGIFIAYYFASRYTDALRLAREYQQYLSTYIGQNFDLMTQNEREALLNGFGTGSMPLLRLLPQMPEQLVAECYDAALRDKGILLRASDRIQRAIAASGNDTLIHAVDSLRMIQQQLGAVQGTDQQAQGKFIALREQMDRLERYIARKATAFKSEEDVVPTWQQVREKLRKDEAAVEFVMTDSAMMALVLTPHEEQPEFVFLMGPEEAPRLQEMLTGKTPAELSSSLYGKGHTYVYEKFWQPLEAHFHGATKIYFSPTGILNSFSFAAFTLPDNSYLIDHYELHQLTSTARLAYRDSRKKAQKKSKTAQVYGALYYNEEQQEYYEPRLAEMRQSFQSDILMAQNGQERGQTESFPFLENSLYEADAITSLLNEKGVSTQEHIGAEPIEQVIRKMSGNSPDILLISTHGFFYNDIQEAKKVPYLQKRQNALNPMTTTGLILANGEMAWQGEQLEDDSDNILSSQEVASLNLSNTQLAVLSACETGLGASNMEGVYGLQRGFKQAGVRSLCASLWSVNDLSTAQLMQSFFRQWLSGKKGMTMQQAMITAMKEQRARTPEPYYWAPFVIYDADF